MYFLSSNTIGKVSTCILFGLKFWPVMPFCMVMPYLFGKLLRKIRPVDGSLIPEIYRRMV